MTDKFKHDVKELLRFFETTLAERDACRAVRKIEKASADTANWETVYKACEIRAKELFQPALSDLGNDTPLSLVLERLLERLEASQK